MELINKKGVSRPYIGGMLARKRKLIDKKVKKQSVKKCKFCELDDYALLHCHRIVPGEDGGRYTDSNVVVACANCHTKIHDGQIIIDRPTSAGIKILHFWENDEEKWE